MRFIVIGLGSMGKRRIRCLQTLGFREVFGVDIRQDRRQEAETLYGIRSFSDICVAINEVEPAALIISVPPDIHHEYIKVAIDFGIHFFVEASVVDIKMREIIHQLKNSPIIAAPSSTLYFHPAIQLISKMVESNELGKISNIILHSGQFLPDWHTYENVSDYYVSNPATGGGREIVPFELTWFTKVFGFPKRVCGNFRKTIDIFGAQEIDDTYNCLLDYGSFLAVVVVDVVSRHATRRLLINSDKKQLIWDWDTSCVKIFDPEKQEWKEISYTMKDAADGYNANIGENMYVDEINCFIDAIQGQGTYINSMECDYGVLKLLYAIEKADKTSQYVEVK